MRLAASLRTAIGITRHLVSPALIVFTIGVVVGAPAPVAGATRTWDGGSLATQNWTDPLNWVGDVAPVAGDTVVFDATSAEPVTINANATVQGVTIAAAYTGVITQAPGTTMTVTGGVADFIQAGGTFVGGTAAITVSDQFTLSGGSFTSTSATLTVNGAFTVSGGSFAHNGGTVAFAVGNVTIDVPTSLTLNNASFLSGTKTIAAGDTLDVAGTLNLAGGVVNTGTLAAQGAITVQAGFTGNSSATLLINGPTDQTMTGFHAVGSGDLPAVVIDKPSGSLTLDTSGTGILRTSDNWTYLNGGLVTTGSTVVFTGGTISGDHTLNTVEIRGGTVTIAAGTTLTAAGTLDLFSGALNTGTLAVEGDLFARVGFTSGGTATVLINGLGPQTFTGFHNSTTGSLPNLTIDKPAASLTLSGTFRTGRNWTYLNGGLVTTGSTVVFTGNLTISGTHTLDAVELRSGDVVVAAGDTVSVNGLLTLVNGNLEGGTMAALGDISLLDTYDGETGTLLIAGTGTQTFTGSATTATGDVANIVVDKPSGTLFLAGTIRLLTSSWTWLDGTVDAGTSLVVFDTGTTINAPGMAFFDVQVTGGTATLLDDLHVDGDLWVSGGTLALAGLTATIAGTVTIDGAIAPGTGELVMDGTAPQTLGGTAASIGLHHLTADNAAGVAIAAEVHVAGTLTLIGPLSFAGETLGIANLIAGTSTNLSADVGATLEIFGTGAGIVVPASLPILGGLAVDNPNGAALAAPITIGQTLTLTDGILRSRPSVLTIDPAGSVVRTAGHVDGALRKTIPLGGGTVVYEVGDATSYTPVALTFGMVSGSAPITALTTPGEHPSISTSPIDPDLDVNRWWSVTNEGAVFDSVDVTYTWASADVDPGADPMAFVVGKWGAGWTLPVAGLPSPTSIMAYGLTSFSEFAVGELAEGELMPDTAHVDDVPAAPLFLASLITTLGGLLMMFLVHRRQVSSSRPARIAALPHARWYSSEVPVVEVPVVRMPEIDSARPEWEIDWQELYR